MDNIREFPIFTYQACNGGIKRDGKTVWVAADDFAANTDLVIEIKEWKFQHNSLVDGDAAPRADKHPIGTDAFSDVAEYALTNGILRNDI
jgi:hypothetical protein